MGCKIIIFNKTQKQAYVTRTCGVWCLLFLYLQHYSKKIIFGSFSGQLDELMKNEKKLQDIAYQLFPNMEKIYKRKCTKAKGQICKIYVESFY